MFENMLNVLDVYRCKIFFGVTYEKRNTNILPADIFVKLQK